MEKNSELPANEKNTIWWWKKLVIKRASGFGISILEV